MTEGALLNALISMLSQNQLAQAYVDIQGYCGGTLAEKHIRWEGIIMLRVHVIYRVANPFNTPYKL